MTRSHDARAVVEDAEQRLVGMVLASPECGPEVVDRLPAELFSGRTTRRAMAVIAQLVNEGTEPDVQTVCAVLTGQGHSMTTELATMLSAAAPVAMLDRNERVLREGHMRERILTTGREALAKLEGAVPGIGTGVLDAIAEISSAAYEASCASSRATARDVDEVMTSVISELADARTFEVSPAIYTGLDELDATLGGLRATQLIVVGGRPSTGKSLMLAKMAWSAASTPWTHLDNRPAEVLYFSLEMRAEEIVQRLGSSLTGISVSKILDGLVGDDELGQLYEAREQVRGAPLRFIDSGRMGIEQISLRARAAKAMGRLDVLVIDYLGLLDVVPGQPRWEQIGRISSELKRLAMDLKIPVLVGVQLNRESERRPNQEPRLADIRDSGSVEQDANAVVLLHRPGLTDPTVDKDRLEAIVAKNRSGRTGTVSLSVAWDTMTISQDTANYSMELLH